MQQGCPWAHTYFHCHQMMAQGQSEVIKKHSKILIFQPTHARLKPPSPHCWGPPHRGANQGYPRMQHRTLPLVWESIEK